MTLQELFDKAIELGATPTSEVDFDVMSINVVNGKPQILIS